MTLSTHRHSRGGRRLYLESVFRGTSRKPLGVQSYSFLVYTVAIISNHYKWFGTRGMTCGGRQAKTDGPTRKARRVQAGFGAVTVMSSVVSSPF